MKWYYNLKISKKLTTAFITVALIACVVGTVGIISINKVKNLDMDMYKNNTVAIQDLSRLVKNYETQRVKLRDIILNKDAQARQESINKMTELKNSIDNDLRLVSQSNKDKQVASYIEDLKDNFKKYTELKDSVIQLVSTNHYEEANNKIYTVGPEIAKGIEADIEKITDFQLTLAKDTAESNNNTARSASIVMIVVIIAGMALAILIGSFLSRIICTPIIKLVNILEKMAEGSIDEVIEIKSQDEIGSLSSSVNKVTKALNNLLEEQEKLATAADEGRLDVRGDVDEFKGSYRRVIVGMNRTLESIYDPLEETKKVLLKMAVNDYTLEAPEKYNGMYNELAVAINDVRKRLLNAQDMFVRTANGDTSRLEEYKKIGKRSENDKLIPSNIAMMEAIEMLIDEVETLAFAAINGELSVRGNVNKFNGKYRDVIEGMNKTLNAIVKPIEEASHVLDKMAKGNFTYKMEGEYSGAYAKLKDSLNNTISSFNEVLNDINNASEQVSAGAQQISDSAQALARGTTEQASSIEELTAALEEISAQTNQNAENANKANEMSSLARKDAVKGNNHMREMLESMNEINESSGNISKIIKVIDDIAFQTNILALNAAVEAARAGQHGKGFAVVAEEVRNLAIRSANAAKETTALIEGSIKKVEEGTKIAVETADDLNKIVEAVTQAGNLVGEIATSSNEQASGISQINEGIMQVSQVVQANSASSEEGASSSEELASQAEALKNLVSKFELNREESIYKGLEGLNPEVLRFLSKNEVSSLNNNDGTKKSSKININLNDVDFGKY